MARKAFYSFHYVPDNWRAGQVRSMGVIEGNAPCSDNDWESVKRGGDAAIQRWIDNQLFGKSVAIVLIGANTAGRRWINYEIQKAWAERKGVLGIHIHNLKDRQGYSSSMGANPFHGLLANNRPMSSIVKTYNPPGMSSTDVYNYIKLNMADWIEAAIATRAEYA
jgi:hypothetical protein